MNSKILVTKLNENQVKDSGMAFVLICLLLALVTGAKAWITIGTLLLIINMTYSKIYYFPAILWLSLANLLGLVSSKVLLTIIFFLVITPIGLIRQLLSKINPGNTKYDSMKRKSWKKSNESVFINRNKKFKAKDLVNPF